MHKTSKQIFNYLDIIILRFEYFIRNGDCISFVSNLVCASPI